MVDFNDIFSIIDKKIDFHKYAKQLICIFGFYTNGNDLALI